MANVTQMALVLSREAVWEFDPCLEENILGSGIDVIAAIRTLTVKVRKIFVRPVATSDVILT